MEILILYHILMMVVTRLFGMRMMDPKILQKTSLLMIMEHR